MSAYRLARLAVCVSFLLVLAASPGICVIYVRADSPGPTFDGASWDSAYQTIQAGINAATSGQEVWVAQGTYSGAVTMKVGVTLKGGYKGSAPAPDTKDPKQYAASISSNVTMPGASVVDGFNIDGSVSCGAGDIVRGNNISSGITATGSGLSITRNYCGGITVQVGSSGTISSNTITRGGIVLNGSMSVTGNTIAASTTGISMQGASSVISSNIIAKCGTGISVSGSIVPTFSHNDVWDNGLDYAPSTLSHPTDISMDPHFAGFAANNLHIRPDSPCRNAGDDSAPGASPLDIDGQARPEGVQSDIGSDESYDESYPEPYPLRTIYVNRAAAAGGDGTSWEKAYQTISATAGDVGTSGPAQIWVAKGLYRESFWLRSFTQLYGGFNPGDGWAQRDPRDKLTIVDNPSALVYSACVLDGFVLAGGLGTAVLCSGGAITVSGNVVYGGDTGIAVGSGAATIRGNRVIGAIRAGIECEQGGIGLIVDNVVVASHTYGININTGPDRVINNTLVGNPWLAIRCARASDVTIANNIFANNGRGIDMSSFPSVLTLSHNDMFGNGIDYNPSTIAHSTDIAVDPLLASTGMMDAHIRPGSPCRDAGDSAAAGIVDMDMDGQARVQGSGVDIGADESYGEDYPAQYSRGVVYVDAAAPPTGDGSSWASAYRDITTGICAAATKYGLADVWVAKGNYQERIPMCFGVDILGGFLAGDGLLDRDLKSKAATITWADSAGPVVIGSDNSMIEGFTITGARYGVECWCTSPTVSRCTITGNSYGVYCESQPQCGQSSAQILCNTIRGNAYHGVQTATAAPIISGNLIANQGRWGVYVSGSTYQGNSPVMCNNTVTGNGTSSSYGALYATVRLTASNNILSGRTGVYSYNGDDQVLTRNNVWNCLVPYYPPFMPHSTDISVDPGFVDPLAGDYHLAANSPCINVGSNTALGLPVFDFDGEGRVAGGRVDIGADEFWPENPPMSDLKTAPDGAFVHSKGAVVTAPLGDSFYIESDNRASGIRVDKPGNAIGRWTRADVTGFLQTDSNGERFIEAATAGSYGSGTVGPLTVTNKALGGGKLGSQTAVWGWRASQDAQGNWQLERAEECGLSNIGVLVRTSGRITGTEPGFFRIDDGSGENVKCALPPGVSVDPGWSYAIVTGISSCERIGGEVQRVLRIRDQQDILGF